MRGFLLPELLWYNLMVEIEGSWHGSRVKLLDFPRIPPSVKNTPSSFYYLGVFPPIYLSNGGLMPDTLQNIKLPSNTWTDLYAASGVVVGVQIAVQNLSDVEVKLHTSLTAPSATDARNDDTGSFSRLKSYQESVNDSGDSGAWAYAHSDGLVNVKVF